MLITLTGHYKHDIIAGVKGLTQSLYHDIKYITYGEYKRSADYMEKLLMGIDRNFFL